MITTNLRKIRLPQIIYRNKSLAPVDSGDRIDIFMGVPMWMVWSKDDYIPSFIPKVIYLITRNGIVEEHRHSRILKICRQIEREQSYLVEPNDFLFFRKKEQVYVGNWDGENISPFNLPNPADIKLTSISLYAKVETFPKTVTRLISRRAKNKDDTGGGKSVFYWMLAVMGVVLLIIYLLIATVTADTKVAEAPQLYPSSSYPVVTETIVQPGHQADLTIPVKIPPPVNYAQSVYQPGAAKGVPIE